MANQRACVDAADRGNPVVQPPSAVAASLPFFPSRMITPRAWTRSDSIASAETP
jgi:hypothetical protein